MKKAIKSTSIAILFIVVFALFLSVSLEVEAQEQVCEAFSVYDMLSPKIISFYESEIAGEKVISNKSAKQIEGVASRFSISVQKAKGVMLVYDFCNRTGGGTDFPTIAQMSEKQVIELVKARAKVYEQSLTPEKKKELKRKSKEILGFSL